MPVVAKLLIAALLSASTTAGAAEAAKAKASVPAKAPAPAVEPEYVGIPYYLDAKAGELKGLERQTYAMRSKVKGLGFGGASASYRSEEHTSELQSQR